MPQWEPLEATGFPPAPRRQVEGSLLSPWQELASGSRGGPQVRTGGLRTGARAWQTGVLPGTGRRPKDAPRGVHPPPSLPCISRLPQRGQQMGPM